MARLIGQALSERPGQQFVVENRPGASGNIGTAALVKATPGYTLLLRGFPNTVNATLFENLSFNFSRGIANLEPYSDARPSFAESVSEFIPYAKPNPGKIEMATSDPGNTPEYVRRGVQEARRRQFRIEALQALQCSAEAIPGRGGSQWASVRWSAERSPQTRWRR